MTGLRITSVAGKVSYFVVGYVVLLCAAIFSAVLFSFVGGAVVYVTLFVAWAAFGVRCFRGEGEPVAPPRPWWKLTARPTAGWVLTALLIVQSAVILASLPAAAEAAGSVLVAVIYVVVAGLFAYSSVRLGARLRVS